MLPEIARRLARGGDSPEEIERRCARVSVVRSLKWPTPGDQLSVDVFIWMLDYAAEPINLSRLNDVR